MRDLIAYQQAKTLAEASANSEIETRAEDTSENAKTELATAALDGAFTSEPIVDLATDERTTRCQRCGKSTTAREAVRCQDQGPWQGTIICQQCDSEIVNPGQPVVVSSQQDIAWEKIIVVLVVVGFTFACLAWIWSLWPGT